MPGTFLFKENKTKAQVGRDDSVDANFHGKPVDFFLESKKKKKKKCFASSR